MSDSETAWIFILVTVLTSLGVFTGMAIADNGGDDLIEKCQEALPRNQVCILQAVPKEVKP